MMWFEEGGDLSVSQSSTILYMLMREPALVCGICRVNSCAGGLNCKYYRDKTL